MSDRGSAGDRAQLWLLAGGNGAGRSTFYRQFLRPRGIAFVNADRIARAMAPSAPEAVSYDAVRLAEQARYRLLDQRRSFCFETVFSHPSKVDFVADAKAAAYEVVLVVIHLESPELHLARVAQRVCEGGHDVPEDKVRARLPRTLRNVQRALPLADEVHLLDNSRWDDPFRRVASLLGQEVVVDVAEAPAWAQTLLRETGRGPCDPAAPPDPFDGLD